MKWPTRLTGSLPLASWLNSLLESARSTQIKPGIGYRIRSQSLDGVVLEIDNKGGGVGSYKGEYDSTKSYSSGDTFSVAVATTIAGISVPAGLYGVPPAGTDSLGTWAGSVPANPIGNQVPQDPLPLSGTLYARLISGSCSIL